MTWLAETARDGTSELERAFGLVPEAYAHFRKLVATLDDARVIPTETLALCRLRIETLLGCAPADPGGGSAGISAERARSLPRYAVSPTFSETDRVCIAYAEQYVLDPHGFTDADFTKLNERFSPEQISTLTLAVAVYDALARFRLALGIDRAAETRP